jgi:Zn ribbon nucleic-acid-binding protein
MGFEGAECRNCAELERVEIFRNRKLSIRSIVGRGAHSRNRATLWHRSADSKSKGIMIKNKSNETFTYGLNYVLLLSFRPSEDSSLFGMVETWGK